MDERPLNPKEQERMAEAEATALRMLFRATRTAPSRNGMNSKYGWLILGVVVVPAVLAGILWLLNAIGK